MEIKKIEELSILERAIINDHSSSIFFFGDKIVYKDLSDGIVIYEDRSVGIKEFLKEVYEYYESKGEKYERPKY